MRDIFLRPSTATIVPIGLLGFNSSTMVDKIPILNMVQLVQLVPCIEWFRSYRFYALNDSGSIGSMHWIIQVQLVLCIEWFRSYRLYALNDSGSIGSMHWMIQVLSFLCIEWFRFNWNRCSICSLFVFSNKDFYFPWILYFRSFLKVPSDFKINRKYKKSFWEYDKRNISVKMGRRVSTDPFAMVLDLQVRVQSTWRRDCPDLSSSPSGAGARVWNSNQDQPLFSTC